MTKKILLWQNNLDGRRDFRFDSGGAEGVTLSGKRTEGHRDLPNAYILSGFRGERKTKIVPDLIRG